MNLIRGAVHRPIAVIAAVVVVVLFGMVALQRIPIQLTPDVRKPQLTIRTDWPGAAPAEIEREIMIRQEDALKGLEGLRKIEGSARVGRSSLTLEFPVGQDINRILLLVSNRLDGVSDYPDEVGVPRLSTRGSEDSPIAWFSVRRAPGNDRPIHEYGDFLQNIVSERIERIPGVGGVNIYGETEAELQIIIRPESLARYGLTVERFVSRLRAADLSMTAGEVNEGKRRYTVCAESPLDSPEAVRKVLLRAQPVGESGAVARLTVGDVAEVAWGYKESTALIRHLGTPALAMNVQRELGANVIEVMDLLRDVVGRLADGPLRREGLVIKQVYDETNYIDSAIDLVQQNIWVGGLLAAFVIILFLRTWRATLIITVAIPISIIGAFVALAAFGRSINVISLAGMAFAVGMVVDAAIVVLENIFRLREQGLSARQAAIQGAEEVWGAILASVLTTVLVFIPILVMELEVGQLFRDIAIAISVSVMISLIVAITLIPALCSYLLAGDAPRTKAGSTWPGRLVAPVFSLADAVGRIFRRGFDRFLTFSLTSWGHALAIVLFLTTGALLVAALLLPPLSYLPAGKRNLVFGFIQPPPGYNLATMTEIARTVEDAARPLWEKTDGIQADGPPSIQNFFFVALKDRAFVGVSTHDSDRVAETIPIIRKPVLREQGAFALFSQYPLFGRGLGGSNSVELNISGGDLEQILIVARKATGLLFGSMPSSDGHQFRPIPGLEFGAPEVRIIPDRARLADIGINPRELGLAVDAFNDQLRIAEITSQGRRFDLTLRGDLAREKSTQWLGKLPIVTSEGSILPLESLARIRFVSGPTEIRHLDRERTVTLQIKPDPSMALETGIDIIRSQVVEPLRAGGLPEGVTLQISGTADQLDRTWRVLSRDLLLALVIVFLAMAILFESFTYPLVIMISAPPAAAGGVLGLALLNLFTDQKLDMLTMLGGIILVGIVVNNAILLADRSLYLIRKGSSSHDALRQAVHDRLRPIFMSTLTSVFGMTPLVLFPGAGSELYRGLGSVVCGGLMLSAFLTLFILPPLMALALRLRPIRRIKEEARPAMAGE